MALDLSFKPFSGVGIVTMYPITAGVIGAGIDLGEVPGFDITSQAPVAEMNTSRNVSRGTAYRMAQRKAANLKMTLKTMSDFTLGLLCGGAWTDVAASAAVPGWVAPAGLMVKNVIRLPSRNVSAVVVKDSTSGTPKVLPVGQYDLDPVAGTIALKDITTGGAYVQPFKVDYTPGAVSVMGAYQAPETEFLVMLNGTNAYNGDRGILEGFRFRFSPDGETNWITEEYGTYSLNGGLLLDESRAANAAGGQYYSFTKVAA